jgi:hypothetical protein
VNISPLLNAITREELIIILDGSSNGIKFEKKLLGTNLAFSTMKKMPKDTSSQLFTMLTKNG